jgi:hypothetical protein
MYVTLAYYHGGDTLQHRLIRWWTGGDFSHVELIDTETGMCWSSSSKDNGVRRKFIDLTNGRWTIVQYDLPFEAKPVEWFEDHEGSLYDWNTIANYVWSKFISRDGEYTCSVAIIRSLGFASIDRITPSGLHDFLRPYEHKVIRFVSGKMVVEPSALKNLYKNTLRAATT